MVGHDHMGAPAVVGDRPSWRSSAACRHSKLDFFSVDKDVQKACIEVCRHCAVVTECLRQAVGHREHEGVWAGEVVTRRRVRALAERLYGPMADGDSACADP